MILKSTKIYQKHRKTAKVPAMMGLQSRGSTGAQARETNIIDGSFNTIAQLPTTEIKKKARAKWYTKQIVIPLIELNTSLKEYYIHARDCNNKLLQTGKTIKASYCNTRVCNVCNRLRTAKAMNGYMKPLTELMQNGQLEFVTLTDVNVKADEFQNRCERMKKDFSNIIRVLNEKRGFDCSGIRKIESTHNLERDDYHPHLHILVDKGVGQIIIDEWLIRNPTAYIGAQKVQQADAESLHEIFKYTTKFVERIEGKPEIEIVPHAIDVIMQGFYNKRTFQNFGKLRKVSEILPTYQKTEYINLPYEEYESIVWEYDTHDWYVTNSTVDFYNIIHKKDIKMNKPLTNYKPPDVKFNIIHINQ